MTHDLQLINPFFDDALKGLKHFELLYNARDFKVNDQLLLREFDPVSNSFSGRKIFGTITYLLHSFPGLTEGYVIFSYSIVYIDNNDHFF